MNYRTINPELLLNTQMTRLNLSYIGDIRKPNFLEKTIMLENMEGKRRTMNSKVNCLNYSGRGYTTEISEGVMSGIDPPGENLGRWTTNS